MPFKKGTSGYPGGTRRDPDALTPKETRFVAEYLTDLNATKAAAAAGYSARTAKAIGSELLKRPRIKAAIAERQAELAEKIEVTQEWVVGNLKSVADRCLENGEAFNPAGANRALELLGKHLGMFAEKHEHGGPGGGPIPFSVIERRIVRSPNRNA